MDIIEEQHTFSSRKPTSNASCSGPDSTSLNVNPSSTSSKLLLKKKSTSRLKRPQTAPVSSIPLPVLPVVTKLEEACLLPLPFEPNSFRTPGQFWLHTEESRTNFLTTNSGMNLDARPSLATSSKLPDSTVSETTKVSERKESYDWNLFMSAYSLGQWDPAQVPVPPTLTMTSPQPQSHSGNSTPQYEHLSRPALLRRSMTSTPSSAISRTLRSASSESTAIYNSQLTVPSFVASRTLSSSSVTDKKRPLSQRRENTPQLPLEAAFRVHRHSDSDGNKRPFLRPSDEIVQSTPLQSPGNSAALAATLRWAASGVSVSPLAVPSPERELTDPFHDAPTNFARSEEPKSTAVRQTKSSITPVLWKGVQTSAPAVEIATRSRASSLHQSTGSETSPGTSNSRQSFLRPTTLPVKSGKLDEADDYFTLDRGSHVLLISHSQPESSAGSTVSVDLEPPLNRKVSEPISMFTALLPRHSSNEIPPALNKPSTSVKHPPEEDFYCQHQYLRAPIPPDEQPRLRALYRFNLLNTAKDPNFDRIAHLAKLVFQTSGVGISLISTDEQWFKAEAGMSLVRTGRDSAFCAHTILQRSDEPTISLDVTKDWRFASNPLVTGPPGIRFYAGAPLRTADGFNIGSLCLLDDRPHTEFTPRHRHALKEFAAIIVREMELWRDKIQLRIRDRIQLSMESFARETLQTESDTKSASPLFDRGSMEHIYNRAVELVKRTLDVEGACIMDVSRSGLHDVSMNSEGSIAVNVYSAGERAFSGSRGLPLEEYESIVSFFSKHRDGYASENHIPSCFRNLLSGDLLNVLVIPVFDVDERPFALLAAYNTSCISNNFLDGHELPYLRAMGVIILSAVLKRRMSMADSAKSLFISNISHELRTPLHGILAAAELLADSRLNHHQQAFLQTVQACGASLVETVNHVLDYTKLSGNTQAGGVEHVIPPTNVDLMQLIEEAVEGCWIGFRARSTHQATSGTDIGTFYSPPTKPAKLVNPQHVETVVDISLRRQGWHLTVEKGGIRRVLMNLIGNSLKFTLSGFIRVTLREVPTIPSTPPDHIRIEIAVIDTGKGISKSFLEGQLFQPFSQENPLQTGTGLGLAIVKSIVNSKGVRGELDVSSKEGSGTEMRISFDVEAPRGKRLSINEDATSLIPDASGISVHLVSFDERHNGKKLLKDTVSQYLTEWWGFILVENFSSADILVVDEDVSILKRLSAQEDYSRPVILLSSVRGDTSFMSSLGAYDNGGGFCRALFKPGGPSKLRQLMMTCVRMVKMIRAPNRVVANPALAQLISPVLDESPKATYTNELPTLSRRISDSTKTSVKSRPCMLPRSTTYHKVNTTWQPSASFTSTSVQPAVSPPELTSPTLTVSVGTDALLLKSSINSMQSTRTPRILIVEDNHLLRSLLIKWISGKGYDYREATDGQQGVDIFLSDGPFDIVLIDLSMPVLDGIGATTQIRRFEASLSRSEQSGSVRPVRILALTGMSGLDDKRRAFEAGVDGYLVKPVAFKTLNVLFQQLGVT